MMHEVLEQGLSDREERAWQKSRQVREMVDWLRTQAAAQDVEMFWYAVRTRRASADSVAEELDRHGITVLCPMEKVVKRLPRKQTKVTVETPMFNRYFFVRLVKFEAAWLGVMTFDGVDCLLGSGETPQAMPERFIAKIQRRCEKGRVNTSALFQRGDKALVTRGPFTSLEATVVSDEGEGHAVDIEIDIFGRMAPCRIGIDHLKKLA